MIAQNESGKVTEVTIKDSAKWQDKKNWTNKRKQEKMVKKFANHYLSLLVEVEQVVLMKHFRFQPGSNVSSIF